MQLYKCVQYTAQKTILPPESNHWSVQRCSSIWSMDMVRQRATVDSSGCWPRGKVCAPESLLPYLLNKYTVWVIVVQQRWITGSQINGGIQNSETQPLKQSRDVLHVRKIMMYSSHYTSSTYPSSTRAIRHLQVDYISLPPFVKEKLTFW